MAILPNIIDKEALCSLLQVLYQVEWHLCWNIFREKCQSVKGSFSTGTENFAMALKSITDWVVNVVENLTWNSCDTENLLPLVIDWSHFAENLFVWDLNLWKVRNDKGHDFVKAFFVVSALWSELLNQLMDTGLESWFWRLLWFLNYLI